MDSENLYREWYVVCDPVSRNGEREAPEGESGKSEERNDGGLSVVLTDGTNKREVSRVAFVRRRSSNRKTSFKRQLQTEIRKAEEAAEEINAGLRRAREAAALSAERARAAEREAENARRESQRIQNEAVTAARQSGEPGLV